MEEQKQDEKVIDKLEEKKRRNKKIFKIVMIIIIIILLLLGLKSCSRLNIQNGSLKGEISDGLLPGLSEEEIREKLQKEADASLFSFDINSTPTFENGKAEGNLRIANPPYNTYDMNVVISLDSNGEVIFESGKLKPNQYIEYAKLEKSLQKGQYAATARIIGYDPNSGEYMGEVLAGLRIEVLN